MGFFRKPVAQLGGDDLHELLDEEAVENVRLEFKQEFPGKNEMLKKLSSFANTYGGDLIIGAEEDGEGKLVALLGVDRDDLAGHEQKILAWCYEGVYPPISPLVSPPIDLGNGRYAVVVRVEESPQSPHFLNGRKGCWLRIGEHSGQFKPRLAEEREIEYLLDRRRASVERRLALRARSERRFSTWVEQTYAARESTEGEIGATVQVWLGPRYPAKPLLEIGDLEGAIRQASSRDFGFARPIYQQESLIHLISHNQTMAEVTTWGSVFRAAEIEYLKRVQDPDTGEIVDEDRFAQSSGLPGVLLKVFQVGRELFETVGYEGSIAVSTRLLRIRGIRFGGPSHWRERPQSQLDDEVQHEVEGLVRDLDGPRGLFDRVVAPIAFAYGSTIAAGGDLLDHLYSQGRKWNGWE